MTAGPQFLNDPAVRTRLIEIVHELAMEKDKNSLLEKILSGARELTRADAGTLYVVAAGRLHFKVFQNDTIGISFGPTSETVLVLQPVPIDQTTVSGFSALKGVSLNIEDVYSDSSFDFSGPKKYDQKSGYKSTSMLVVPMRGKSGAVIGVLQLINSKDPATGAVVPFPAAIDELAAAFASHAAETLEA
ncbi:GAF domain-containing protein [bacterium]|nr:MAG: GAF domain-containing protein [bacterium]